MKTRHFKLGMTLLLIGLIILLNQLALLNTSFWTYFNSTWPVLIIMSGIFYIFKHKKLGYTFLILTILLWMTSGIIGENNYKSNYTNTFNQKIDIPENITLANLELDFSVGKLNLESSNESIISNQINTNNNKLPNLEYVFKNNRLDATFERNSNYQFKKSYDESWNMKLDSSLIYDLNLDLGVSNSIINLTNLKVKNLEIQSGVSEINVIFGNYSTTAYIDVGVTNLNLSFPKNKGVKIMLDSGLQNINLQGFIKQNNYYINEDYDEINENININLDAGVSKIRTSFY